MMFVETRQQGRFAGFSVFVSSTGVLQNSTVCYKDGPELPPLNFKTTCIDYGRYVIFYNERLKGDLSITELCEVIVEGMYIICISWPSKQFI